MTELLAEAEDLCIAFEIDLRLEAYRVEAERLLKRAGHVLRFIPSYAALTEALREAGPVHSAFFRRKCGAPTWSRWMTDASRSGG